MATLRLMEQKTTLGFKLESDANKYTNNETLAAADYCFSVYNVSWSPNLESYLRKLARGDYSKDKSVSGRRPGTVTFTVDAHSHTSIDQAPMYFTMLRACGMNQTTYAGTGVGLKTDATIDRSPATIEVVLRQEGTTPKQLVVRLYGCMGNATIQCDQIGQPVKINFTFTGAIGSISTRSYASIITPTSFDTNIPPAVLCATINLFGTTQYPGRFTINLNNSVENFDDASKCSGIDGARVVDRNPTLEFDPDMLVTDDDDLYTDQTTNATGALAVTIGDSLHFNAPAAQFIDTYKHGTRQGHYTNNVVLELKRSSGNDEFQFLQGSET
jgi:hypothetical protein